MFRWRGFGQCLVLLLLLSCSGGCFPAGNHVDEEQDPHFQRGRNLAGGQDFNGAAQEFELALESNPRSAAAHFELGWLCDTKLNDPAAAIYHYEQHLRLQPDSPRAALVRERIRGCKQQLANAEFPQPASRNLQHDLDRVNAENQSLRQQIEALKIQLANANSAPAQTQVTQTRYNDPIPPANYGNGRTIVTPVPSAHGHTHVVQAHETISSIAAQHGLKASDVLAANPHVNPRRLRVGQILNLP